MSSQPRGRSRRVSRRGPPVVHTTARTAMPVPARPRHVRGTNTTESSRAPAAPTVRASSGRAGCPRRRGRWSRSVCRRRRPVCSRPRSGRVRASRGRRRPVARRRRSRCRHPDRPWPARRRPRTRPPRLLRRGRWSTRLRDRLTARCRRQDCRAPRSCR